MLSCREVGGFGGDVSGGCPRLCEGIPMGAAAGGGVGEDGALGGISPWCPWLPCSIPNPQGAWPRICGGGLRWHCLSQQRL